MLIGSDLVYDPSLHDDLLSTLSALAGARGAECRVVLALPDRDDGGALAQFRERGDLWSWLPALVARPVGVSSGSSYPTVVLEGRYVDRSL